MIKLLDLPCDLFNVSLKFDKTAGLAPCDLFNVRPKFDETAGLAHCNLFNFTPNFYKTASSFSHKKLGKAHGEDKRGGEVDRIYSYELADAYLPLEIKSKMLSSFPVGHKGGQLFSFVQGSRRGRRT